MSALPPKADMCVATAHVCYGPEADIRGATGPRSLFPGLRKLMGVRPEGARHPNDLAIALMSSGRHFMERVNA